MQNIEFYKDVDNDTIVVAQKPVSEDVKQLLTLFISSSNDLQEVKEQENSDTYAFVSYCCIPQLYSIAKSELFAEIFDKLQTATKFF